MQPDDSQAASPVSPSSPPGRPAWYAGATRGQWLALAAALLGWAFDGFEQGVFPLVARPALIELNGLSDLERIRKESTDKAERERARAAVDQPVREWNAILTASFLFGAALGGLVFGWLGDRIGRVRAMVFSVLAYAGFTGFCGFAGAPWHLAVLRFLAAMGMGGEWSLGVALVMEKWPAHARPVLAGLIGAAANVGFLATTLLSLVLEPDQYWRIFLVVCAFPALLTFLLRLFVPESEKWQEVAAREPSPGIGAIFRPGLRRRALLGAGLGAVALFATWGGVQSIPLWVGQLTSTPHAKTFAQMCSALGAIGGALLAAILGARLSRRWGYFSLCLLSFVVCQALFLTQDQYGFRFLAIVFVAGACTAAFYGWLPLYLPELFPTRVRATGQGFCYNFGRSLAAVGVLVTNFGLDLKGEYARTASIIVLVYLAGMVLAWFIPETKGQPLPE
jgi:MFS family permease